MRIREYAPLCLARDSRRGRVLEVGRGPAPVRSIARTDPARQESFVGRWSAGPLVR
jgi:hypothetical protein